MSTSRETNVVISLQEQDGLGAVSVNSAEFVRFEQALDQRLDQLVQRWLYCAAPQKSTSRSQSTPHKQKPR